MDMITLQYAHYPLLRLGLAFLLFSTVCFLNYYSLHGRSFWKWLGLFIFFMGLHDVLHLIEPIIKAPPLVDLVAVFLLGAAILVFLEIIYSHVKRYGLAFLRICGGLLLLILIVSGVTMGGWKLAHFMTAVFVPFLVGGWMLGGLSLFVKEGQGPWQRSLLRLSMIFMGCYVFTLTVLPEIGVLPIGFWNQEVFLKNFGFPVQILRGIFIVAATIALWIYHARVVKQKISAGAGKFIVFWERIFVLCLGAVLLTGWLFVSWVENKVESDQKNDLLSVARVVTAGVNPRWIEKLSFTQQDLNIPEHIRLREQQLAFGRALKPRGDVRWIYLMVMREGKIVFSTDSISEDDPGYSPPGDVYKDAPEELYKVFHDGQERVIGPYRVQWGVFVSGFVPVRSFETGQVVAVQGVDVNLSIFAVQSFQAKIQIVGILMLIVIFMGGFFLWQIRTHEAEDRLKVAFENLRRAKEDLEHSNELRTQAELQMKDMVEAMPNPVFFKDENGFYRSCNQSFEEYLGLPRERIIGFTVFDVAPRDLADKYHRADLEVMEKGGRQQYEGKVSNANGTFRDVVFYKSVLSYRDGRPRGIVGVILDITERKKIEQDIRENELHLMRALQDVKNINEELEKAQDKLLQSEKLAAIGILAAGVAHEINNPLGFIQGNLTALSQYVRTFLNLIAEYEKIKAAIDETDMVKLKELQNVIKDVEDKSNLMFVKEDVANLLKETLYGVERIHKIVTALQHFSYASHGQKALTRVNDAMEGIMSMVAGEIMCKAELIKEYGDVPAVDANEEQLKQVFINLLLNAAQAIVHRGVIRVKTYVHEKQAVIEIADTGAGISKEQLPKIFDPFFTTKEPGKGTGLGLSISYDIIRKHKGRIEVESEVGKGTTFRIFLPLAKRV
jgi:PAS domain S-box-containing protein